jgi:surface protein
MAKFNQSSNPKLVSFIYGGCSEECTEYDITQHADVFNAVYDFTETGFSRWYKPNGVSFFTTLKCGHIYLAVITEGETEFEIPNSEVVYFENNEASLRYTNDCKGLLPTPTPACPAKVTWEILTFAESNPTWVTVEENADEILNNVGGVEYCTSNYINTNLCGSNDYATNRGWLDNDFSDVRNIKYVDCDGNEYEPTSIQYKVDSVSNCGNDTSNVSGIFFDLCFEVDCSKLSYEIKTNNGTWIYKEISGKSNLILDEETNLLCSNHWKSGICVDSATATELDLENGNYQNIIRNFKYTDCNGTEYETSTIEYRLVDGLCGDDANGKIVEFRVCIDVSTPTPTPTSSKHKCIENGISVTVSDGKYIFGTDAYYTPYLLNEGQYTIFNNNPDHPIILQDHDESLIKFEGTLSNGGYVGQIDISVFGDFGTVSYVCTNHGYMGGQNNLQFSAECEAGNPVASPTPSPTPTPTPLPGTLGTPQPTAVTPTSSQILTWSWLPITNATSYGIWVDDFNGNPDKVIEANGNETIFSYTHQALLENGEHTIRVIAMDADGKMSNPGTHTVTINTSLPTNNLGLQWVVKPDDLVVENTSETWTWMTNHENVKYNYKLFVAGSSVSIAEANDTTDTTLTTTIPNGENDYVMVVTMIKSDNTVETLIHRFTTLIAQIKYTFRIPSKEEYPHANDSITIRIPIYDCGTGTTIDWEEDNVNFFSGSIGSSYAPSAVYTYPLGEESYTKEVVVRGDVRSFFTNYTNSGTSGTWPYLEIGYCYALQSVEIVGMNSIVSAQNMFIGCNNLTSVDVSKWNSSNVTSCYRMFRGCSSLVNLDLSALNTSKVTMMGEMFHNCTSLTNLNIVPNETNGTWNTSGVTNMAYMFYNCSSLEYMLPENYSITSGFVTLDRTNAEIVFDTSEVTNMDYMFNNCSSLKNLYATNWNTSKVLMIKSMFKGCASMNFLDCGNWNTSAVVKNQMSSMFQGCGEMNDASVDFSSWCVVNQGFTEPTNFRLGSNITESPAWGQSC